VKSQRFVGALLAALLVTTAIASAANVNIYGRGGLKPRSARFCNTSADGYHCAIEYNRSAHMEFYDAKQDGCAVSVERTGSIINQRWDVVGLPANSRTTLQCSVRKTGENDFEIFPPKS
jgi:hypothetical protein